MVKFGDLKPELIAGDAGLGALILLVLMSSAILFYLYRRVPRWRMWFTGFGTGVPLVTGAFVSPILALLVWDWDAPRLLENVSGWISRRLRLGTTAVFLVVIVLVGVAIRLPRMGESLWYDEAFSVQLVSLPLANIPAALLADVHPPAYYAVLWATLKVLGISPVAARLPSLFFGLLSIVLMFRIGRHIFSERVGLMAALLVAVSPAAAYYSIEARSYAMLMAEVFGLVLCVLEDRPKTFAVLGGLVCWTHNFGYLYLAVFGLVIALREIGYWLRGRRRIWFLALVGSGAIALCWLPFMMREAATVVDGYWMYLSVWSYFTPMVSMTVGVLPSQLVLPVLLPLLFLLVFALVYVWKPLTFSANRWLLLVVFLVPALAMIVSLLWRPVFLARALLPSMQLLLLFVAMLMVNASLGRLVRRTVAVMMAFALMALFSWQLRPAYEQYLQEFCGQYGAPLYHTSMATAFVASHAYRSDLPQLDWTGARDQGDTFDTSANAIYGFQTGALESLTGYKQVCLMQMLTPLSKDDELAYVASVEAKYPHIVGTVQVDLYFILRFVRLELPS